MRPGNQYQGQGVPPVRSLQPPQSAYPHSHCHLHGQVRHGVVRLCDVEVLCDVQVPFEDLHVQVHKFWKFHGSGGWYVLLCFNISKINKLALRLRLSKSVQTTWTLAPAILSSSVASSGPLRSFDNSSEHIRDAFWWRSLRPGFLMLFKGVCLAGHPSHPSPKKIQNL